MIVNLYMLCPLIKKRIQSNKYCCLIITKQRHQLQLRHTQASTHTYQLLEMYFQFWICLKKPRNRPATDSSSLTAISNMRGFSRYLINHTRTSLFFHPPYWRWCEQQHLMTLITYQMAYLTMKLFSMISPFLSKNLHIHLPIRASRTNHFLLVASPHLNRRTNWSPVD